jgi:hypothetical protein
VTILLQEKDSDVLQNVENLFQHSPVSEVIQHLHETHYLPAVFVMEHISVSALILKVAEWLEHVRVLIDYKCANQYCCISHSAVRLTLTLATCTQK